MTYNTYMNCSQKGFIAFITVIMVGVSSLIFATGAALLNLNEIDMAYSAARGEEAFSIAQGCSDEALAQLRVNGSYSGAFISFDNGSCIINVATVGNISTSTISASTTNNYYKGIQVVSTKNGRSVQINSWTEI